ncbi:MAG: NUDIX hydrolase [Myxococcales bacterium]|nr:NUDIX hydrolase [Myxococcales bacterium]
MSPTDHDLKAWETLQETPPEDHKIFRLFKRKSQHPGLSRPHDFVIVDCPDWVNMIVLTPEGQVILVEQYRHGSQSLSLEIPGGMVDPGESPEETARRELAEETGYTCEQWYNLGVVEPNPAFQTNRCWTYLGVLAKQTQEQHLDGSEMIHVETCPLSEISAHIKQGEITHSLVIAAFFHYIERFGGWTSPTQEQLDALPQANP